MNFIEAVEDWKSNDEWRYADKEAAWKFFFAAGKESPQAVISAQCVKMNQYESIIFELRQQLSISEEHNARLFRDLTKIADYDSNYGPFPEENNPSWGAMAIVTAREAIRTPASREALDAYVAERMKEAGKFDGWKTNPYTKVLETSIEKLTKQHDLAVEYLKRYRSEVPAGNQPHMICHLVDKFLSAIKESENS